MSSAGRTGGVPFRPHPTIWSAFFERQRHIAWTLRGVFDETGAGRGRGRARRRRSGGWSRANSKTGTGRSSSTSPMPPSTGGPFAHYVCFATRPRPCRPLVHRPAAGRGRPAGSSARRLAARLRAVRRGLPGRPTRPGSGYSRIGWHTDHQSGPHLDIWPGVAFTVHFDPTSPANGFLRGAAGQPPGGHRGMPAGFERVPGGDRRSTRSGATSFPPRRPLARRRPGTADGPAAVRRHSPWQLARRGRGSAGHGHRRLREERLR